MWKMNIKKKNKSIQGSFYLYFIRNENDYIGETTNITNKSILLLTLKKTFSIRNINDNETDQGYLKKKIKQTEIKK